MARELTANSTLSHYRILSKIGEGGHRDIKPENVMIREDGLVKVLDFGLAKLTAEGVSDPESETRIDSETKPGMIIGTRGEVRKE